MRPGWVALLAVVAGLGACEDAPFQGGTRGCRSTVAFIDPSAHGEHSCAPGQAMTLETGRTLSEGYLMICRCPLPLPPDGGL